MATSINSLYTVMKTSILQYLSAEEIARMSCLNTHWNAVANDPIAWKNASYHRTFVTDKKPYSLFNYSYADSELVNLIRKQDSDKRKKLKNIQYHPDIKAVRYCATLSLTLDTNMYFPEDEMEEGFEFTSQPAKWLDGLHKSLIIYQGFINICTYLLYFHKPAQVIKSTIINF